MRLLSRKLAVAGSGLALGVLLLSGCDSEPSASDNGPHGYRGTPVVEVHLSDGTRCAVMDGRGEDLTCDWRGPKGLPDTEPKGHRGSPVTEIRLSDGTRCAVMDNYIESIDCDW